MEFHEEKDDMMMRFSRRVDPSLPWSSSMKRKNYAGKVRYFYGFLNNTILVSCIEEHGRAIRYQFIQALCGVEDTNAIDRVLLRSSKPSLHTNFNCSALAAAVVSRHSTVVQVLQFSRLRSSTKFGGVVNLQVSI